jgi:hypothetical protein
MTWESAIILSGGFVTLGVFSFLIRENPFFRFFEHLFIGVASGLIPLLTFKDFLWPKILSPLLGFESSVLPDGTVIVPYNPLFLLYLFPLCLGLLYYTILIPRYAWLAKLVIGISLGASAGLYFKGFFVEIIPQITGSFKPIVVFEEGGFSLIESFNNIVFVGTLLSVLLYFFFCIRGESLLLRGPRASGRWLMMVCFGAFFGSTVMARMALLVERLQFLINDWAPQVILLMKFW